MKGPSNTKRGHAAFWLLLVLIVTGSFFVACASAQTKVLAKGRILLYYDKLTCDNEEDVLESNFQIHTCIPGEEANPAELLQLSESDFGGRVDPFRPPPPALLAGVCDATHTTQYSATQLTGTLSGTMTGGGILFNGESKLIEDFHPGRVEESYVYEGKGTYDINTALENPVPENMKGTLTYTETSSTGTKRCSLPWTIGWSTIYTKGTGPEFQPAQSGEGTKPAVIARVVKVKGAVWAVTREGAFLKNNYLFEGMPLYAGDTLMVSYNAFQKGNEFTLKWESDGAIINLGADIGGGWKKATEGRGIPFWTIVVLGSTPPQTGMARGEGGEFLDLKSGTIHYSRPKAPEGQRWGDFKVPCPGVVLGTMGTTFYVGVDNQTQITTVGVEEGIVELTPINPSLKPFTIQDCQEVQIGPSGISPITPCAAAPPSTRTCTGTAPSIYVEERAMNPGQDVIIPIMMCNANGIANMDLTVTYDSSVLRFKSATKGSLNAFMLFDYNNVGNTVKIAFAHKLGMQGTGSIAILTFTVIGKEGTSSPITIKVNEASTSSGSPVDMPVQNGQVSVGNTNPYNPSGNPENKPRALDAMIALRMSVGKMDVDMNYDVTKDGKVTSSDARDILLYAEMR